MMLLDELNDRAIDIVSEIASSNFYASFEMVMAVLCDRYSVGSLSELGVNDYTCIPSLFHLANLESRVYAFVHAYFSNGLSSVKTFGDLEKTLVHMLKSFGFSSIPSLVKVFKTMDPNEICIEEPFVISTFSDFGVGPLSMVPAVLHSPFGNRRCFPNILVSDILSHLTEFIFTDPAFSQEMSTTNVDIAAFSEYLSRDVYRVDHISEIGVLIQGSLSFELSAMSHLISMRRKMMLDAQKEALKLWNGAQSSSSYKYYNNGNEKNRSADKSGSTHTNHTKQTTMPELRQPDHELPVAFISACRVRLEQQGKDSAHPASFSQMRRLVQQMYQQQHRRHEVAADEGWLKEIAAVMSETVSPSAARGNCNMISNKRRRLSIGKRKRKCLMLSEDAVEAPPNAKYTMVSSRALHDMFEGPEQSIRQRDQRTRPSLPSSSSVAHASSRVISSSSEVAVSKKRVEEVWVDLATEYAMLHLGGKRYLDKRLIAREQPVVQSLDDNESGGCEDNSVAVDETIVKAALSETPVVENTTAKRGFFSPAGQNATVGAKKIKAVEEEGRECQYQQSLSSAPQVLLSFEGKRAVNSSRSEGDLGSIGVIHGTSELALSSRLLTTDPRLINSAVTVQTADLCGLCPCPLEPFNSCGNNGVNVSTGKPSQQANTLRRVGRWGEMLVYQYLLRTNSDACVEWCNRDVESKAPYDFIVTKKKKDGQTLVNYIEVKTTRFPDNNVFELSLGEWEFATRLPRVRYSIYRVYNAGDSNRVRISIIPDLFTFVSEQKVRICIAM